MKKDYLEPMIKVQKIACEHIMESSTGGISDDPHSGGNLGTHDRDDLLDDWSL